MAPICRTITYLLWHVFCFWAFLLILWAPCGGISLWFHYYFTYFSYWVFEFYQYTSYTTHILFTASWIQLAVMGYTLFILSGIHTYSIYLCTLKYLPQKPSEVAIGITIHHDNVDLYFSGSSFICTLGSYHHSSQDRRRQEPSVSHVEFRADV